MTAALRNEQGDVNDSARRAQYRDALGADTQAWIERDAAVFLHQQLSTPVMNVLARTVGARIYDLAGNSYLDLHGNGVHNAGFSNPEVLAAMLRQMQEELVFTPRRYTNIPAVRLAEKLVSLTPAGLDKVLFCPGGSEAIEMAISLAKHVTGRWKTISFWDSYHGNGFQAASVGGQEHFSGGMGPMMPGCFHVEFPQYYRNPWGLTDRRAIDDLYLRQIREILHRNPDVAAIIGEPISATPVVPSAYYWEQVRAICDEYGIFLIFDEIIEGFGRTGTWFACQQFVTPDVLVLGKSLGGGALPLAGIVTHRKYDCVAHRSIGHFTHEKNPLSASAGLAAIEYIEKHDLVGNSQRLGAYLVEGLRELQREFPVIGNIDGRGMHLGVDLVIDPARRRRHPALAEQVMYGCLQRGVALKVIEGNVLTMRASLVVTQEDCDQILGALAASLREALD
ncbi:aspartate aminotransferase family protein [Verticiella sediminum]|uniref:Aspartate aminotransferase family protein n=1 Tax=Verticiella sediminum TaxID=1247510 RepID=A0A556B179_9BURK|nr:aspartate aminotransferase family protein [Verticiella sediminum]TSH98946.1 aspartate aminotransferase family protein [Verticiella sediminum]